MPGGLTLLTPLPRRTRLRLALAGLYNRFFCWAAGRGRPGLAVARMLLQAAELRRRRRAVGQHPG